MPGDVLRVADDVDGQPLLGAGLGDVEPGLVVENHARGERVLAAGPGRQRRHLVLQRIQPPRARCDDQVEPADVDVQELAVPGDVLDQQPLERPQRRVEGLERAERRDVHGGDRMAVQPAPEVEGQGFHLGQLGHPRSLGGYADRIS